jgi:branched-chain amino acid transport system permease protein
MSVVLESKGKQLDVSQNLLTTVQKKSWMPTLVGYIVCMYFLAHSSSYHQGLVLVAATFGMLALSLDLVAGATGLYSLGHAGLFAIGAYGTAILAEHYGWNLFVALPVVVVVAGLVGLVIGALSLRVSGLYFAITTLIFTIIVTVLVSNLSITGGYQGLSSPTFPSFSSSLTSAVGSSLTWAVAGCFLVTVVVVWSIRSSAMYPILLAIRDSEKFASAAGVRTARTKICLFGLSAAIAGLAGWAFCFLGFITPSQFDATASINILVMVIVGGMNTRLGPIIGAAFVGLFPVIVSINSLWQEVIYGAIFLTVIIFFPEGFVGIISRLWRFGVQVFTPGTNKESKSVAPASTFAVTNSTSAKGLSLEGKESFFITQNQLNAKESSKLDGANASPLAIEAMGICFSYTSGVRVLENVDIKVRRATIHGLIGPNGSGKSTLVDLLSGVITPEEGTITINGHRAETMPSWQRVDLGLMRTFQTAAMVHDLSTKQNVSIGLFNSYDRIGIRSPLWPLLPSGRKDSRTIASSALAALDAVGVSRSWVSTKVADVPHGIEQLTQLAAACVGGPSILILDEPAAGLSMDEVDQLASILKNLRSSGVTTLIIEHQTRFIFDICDEVTVLAAGEVIKSGSASDVRSDVRVREVYLGQ